MEIKDEYGDLHFGNVNLEKQYLRFAVTESSDGVELLVVDDDPFCASLSL